MITVINLLTNYSHCVFFTALFVGTFWYLNGYINRVSDRTYLLRDIYSTHCARMDAIDCNLKHAHRRITGVAAKTLRHKKYRSCSPKRGDRELFASDDESGDILGIMFLNKSCGSTVASSATPPSQEDEYNTQQSPTSPLPDTNSDSVGGN